MRRSQLVSMVAALACWAATATAQTPIFEAACHEGNVGILSGHRAEERAAAR